MKVTAEKFIRIWQSAVSAVDVASKLDTNPVVVSTRASRYRSLGIPLKKFLPWGGHRTSKLNIKRLVVIARDCPERKKK